MNAQIYNATCLLVNTVDVNRKERVAGLRIDRAKITREPSIKKSEPLYRDPNSVAFKKHDIREVNVFPKI